MSDILKNLAGALFIAALGAAWFYALWHPVWWLP